MALCIVQVTIPNQVTNLPADSITNTWHFDDLIGGGPYGNLHDLLKDFYNTQSDYQTHPLTWYYSGNYGPQALIKTYNIGDPKPRVPVDTAYIDLDIPTGTQALPGEVATVMSFGTTPESGGVASRRKNRVYLGPFNTRVLGPEGTILDTFITDIAGAGRQLLEASAASINWAWRGYSPTDAAQFDISGGQIDNEFDTQRRRGVQPDTRTVFADGIGGI